MRTTRWTLVLRAGKGSVSALDELCGAYWFPVYAWFRKKGLGPEDAADQSQEFFTGLVGRGDLGRVKQDGRRFRAWLYAALGHHWTNHRKHANAAKRRGIEVDDAEERFARQVAPGLDPEQTFARQWALAVLKTARVRTRARYAERDDEETFTILESVLTGMAPPYRDLAASLNIQESAVKVAVHRLRRRFGEALREEVAETLDGPDDIETELQHLMDALAGR